MKTKKITNNGKLPIGAYFGPFPKDARWPDDPDVLNDKSYKLAADGGFNFMIGYAERYPVNKTDVRRSMDCAERNGMKMILSDENVEQGTIEYLLMRTGKLPDIKKDYESSMADHGNHKGYWGCYVVDEPLPDRFPLLAQIRDIFYSVSPDNLFFVNMLPVYAVQQMVGKDWVEDDSEREELYSKYISGYLDTVRPEMLCYDYYPYLQTFPHFGEDYFVNLAVARRETQLRGLPFWVSMQSAVWGDPNCRGITVGEMRHQVYTSVAFGATGLVYYVWSQSAGHKQGLCKDGKPTYMYPYAQECNLFIGRIQDYLLESENCGVIVSGETPARIPEHSFAINKGNVLSITSKHSLTGVFESGNKFYYLVVNNSITDKDEIKITFKKEMNCVAIFTDGKEEKICGDNFNVKLDIGDCVLIKE